MLQIPAWTSYLLARGTALAGCAAADDAVASIGRAESRLQEYLGMEPEPARAQARRSFLYSGDAAFHDQLLTSGSTDLLQEIVERTDAAEPVLAVDVVIDFRHPVVACIAGGEGTGVGGRVRKGPLDDATRAGGWSQSAAQQF